jgi:hypothetical protein
VSSTGKLKAPWKPGESGNPKGSSAKAGRRRELREALDAILGSVPPAALLDQIPEDVRALLPAHVTFAEIITLRVVSVAATATKPETILAAGRLILDAQSKWDSSGTPARAEPPRLPTTEERRLAIARQLGLEDDQDDDETTPINGKVRR